MLNLLCLFSPKKQQWLRNVLCCVLWWLCIWCSAWTLVNNTQNWTRRPFIFVIPTRPVSDNFEVKDKKQNVSLGALKFMQGPQRQHFIRGTILNGDQQYMGKFKWEALCAGKAKEICHVHGPFVLLMPPLMSDFDVLLMAKNKKTKHHGSIKFQRIG